MIFVKSRYSYAPGKDARLSYLLVLLWQIDQFLHQLDALPEPELGEIVSAAIQVCGFVEPWEARHRIVSLLEAFGNSRPAPQALLFYVEQCSRFMSREVATQVPKAATLGIR